MNPALVQDENSLTQASDSCWKAILGSTMGLNGKGFRPPNGTLAYDQTRGGIGARRDCTQVILQTRSIGSHCEDRRSRELRRHHRWRRYAFWPHGLANGKLSRSGRRSLVERRSAW